jgi:hypothetical protein
MPPSFALASSIINVKRGESMSVTVWTTLVVGVLAIAGNLLSGYLTRKQMRQNELFRQDPSVGLIPPPHPLRARLWEHRLLIWNSGCSVYFLIQGFRAQEPLTRISVLNISMGVCLFYFAISSHLQDRTLSVVSSVVDLQGKSLRDIFSLLERITTLQGKTLGVFTTQVKRDSKEETPTAPRLKEPPS